MILIINLIIIICIITVVIIFVIVIIIPSFQCFWLLFYFTTLYILNIFEF